VKNWSITFHNEMKRMLEPLPHMDLFLWNVGQHALWSPTPKGKAMRKKSVMMKGGHFAREVERLADVLPPWTRTVYIFTNSLCTNDATIAADKMHPSESGQGYLFSRGGAAALNAQEKTELADNFKRPYRILDSYALTDGRCNYTKDGNHFLPLDKYKVLSLLMELVI